MPSALGKVVPSGAAQTHGKKGCTKPSSECVPRQPAALPPRQLRLKKEPLGALRAAVTGTALVMPAAPRQERTAIAGSTHRASL